MTWEALKITALIFACSLVYTGYVTALCYWIGGWALIPSLTPVFLGMWWLFSHE